MSHKRDIRPPSHVLCHLLALCFDKMQSVLILLTDMPFHFISDPSLLFDQEA